jgi:rhamnosyltransferase
VSSFEASVIVRCRDEIAGVGRALDLLQRQTVRPEIIAVDSGSTDGSLEIARAAADVLIEIPPASFTYGRALNIGADAATAPIHFALSAHCFPRLDWVERSLAHYRDRDVAATNGIQTFADGRPVIGVFLQDWEHARSDPDWGFSNHASSWRGSVWRRHPFDEELDYAEDREWSWRVTREGWTIAFDPALWVDMSHAWSGARDLFSRKRRAARALRTFAPMPPVGLGELIEEWWQDTPDDGHSRLFHRLNYRRMAGLAGKYLGSREGDRRGGGQAGVRVGGPR